MLLQGMNRFNFSIMPWSFISFLFSPKILSFFKKFKTMKRRSGLFLSSIAISKYITFLFFIFLSICKFSAKLRSKWNATKSTFSCFLMVAYLKKINQLLVEQCLLTPSFFSSFLRFSYASSNLGSICAPRFFVISD